MKDSGAIALRIRELMDILGCNQAEFADRCGVAQGNLSAALIGETRTVGKALIGKILKAGFGVNEAWLLRGEGEPLRKEKLPPPVRLQDDPLPYKNRFMEDKKHNVLLEIFKVLQEIRDILSGLKGIQNN